MEHNKKYDVFVSYSRKDSEIVDRICYMMEQKQIRFYRDTKEIPGGSFFFEELAEAIAENAHDIWARARMDEDWTYSPVRDDAKKQYPDLVPYAQLPDSEKEYDRIMAMNTLRLVRRLGFDLINRYK